MTRVPARIQKSFLFGAQPGFTLIELLVVIAIISLLIAILFPALSGVRREGGRAKCLANLSTLGKTSATYALDFEMTGMLAVPGWFDGGTDSWRHAWGFQLASGLYDYGGGNGHEDGMKEFGYHPGSTRDCRNRPLNNYIFGRNNVTTTSDFSMYRCPSDFGLVDAPFYAGIIWRPEWKTRPFWQSTGTSYRANATRAFFESLDETQCIPPDGAAAYTSVSPYCRPASRIPAPSETVLYAEAIHYLAIWNSDSWTGINYTDGIRPGGGITVPGWHGKMGRFNIGFVDGHAATIHLGNKSMDPRRPADDPIDPGFAQLWMRGSGPQRWRMDTRREPLIQIGS